MYGPTDKQPTPSGCAAAVCPRQRQQTVQSCAPSTSWPPAQNKQHIKLSTLYLYYFAPERSLCLVLIILANCPLTALLQRWLWDISALPRLGKSPTNMLPCWFTRECMPPRVTHLRARADGHGLVVVVGARGAVVEQVRPRLVMACRQHAHTTGPLPAALRCHLCPVCQVAHQSRHLDRLLKHKPAGRCKEICFIAVCRYRHAYTTVNCLVCA